ncbi:hypothetical protein GWD52_12365 [Enterobacteriaceae bacterium 4M9]|nr:hypothetical protein [Enterobacteriaceae bacterium 4M9]
MSAISPLPAVQAAACPMLNTSDANEQHIAYEVLLLAIMKEIAALPDGAQHLANIEQCCTRLLGDSVHGESSRIVAALVCAAQPPQ